MRLFASTDSWPPPGRPRRAVFVDKDGTLIEDVPYNVDPELLRFTPRATEALRRLSGAGFMIIVISNQPGIAMGRFDLPALQRLGRALTQNLADEGVALTGFYACPHRPASAGVAASCRCRKPAPGLLLEAAREHTIDLAGSWMIGDILDDIEAGWRAGCRTVHLDVGNETVWRRSPIRTPTASAPDLGAAAEAILAAIPIGRIKSPRGSASRRPVDGVGSALP